jgi:hypothetical protein
MIWKKRALYKTKDLPSVSEIVSRMVNDRTKRAAYIGESFAVSITLKRKFSRQVLQAHITDSYILSVLGNKYIAEN